MRISMIRGQETTCTALEHACPFFTSLLTVLLSCLVRLSFSETMLISTNFFSGTFPTDVYALPKLGKEKS